MAKRACVGLVMLGFAAALGAELPPLPAEPPSLILQFLHGIKDVRDRQSVVLRDAASLERYWDGKKGKPPAIDFAKHVVLLATLGRVSAAANRAIGIEKVEKTPAGALRVHVAVAEGEPISCDETLAAYPCCAVVVEKPSGPVVWASERRCELKVRGEAKGFDSYPNETTAAIRTAESERHYWAGASGPMPKVDFARFTLLGAFRGKVPTTGHEVRVAAVKFVDGELTVFVSQFAPPEGAGMAPIPNHPAHVVAIDRWDGPVRFNVSRAGAAKPTTPPAKDIRDLFK